MKCRQGIHEVFLISRKTPGGRIIAMVSHCSTLEGLRYECSVCLVISNIVIGRIRQGGKNESNRIGGEVLHSSPDHAGNVKTVVGAIEGDNFLSRPVIQEHVKTAGKRDNAFLQFFIGVAPPRFSAWNVVNPVGTGNSERDVIELLDKGKISPVVENPRKLDHGAIIH